VRNRYFDLLRAVAILRVVLYHASGWALLTVVFPAMGVMFALAGSLMAASLDRYGGWRAVTRRLRRVLPPFWLGAAVLVPAMIRTGLPVDWNLLAWVVPLGDPPVNGWGHTVSGIIWYVREYLWFVLLSPLALPFFRRWPVPAFLLPMAALVVGQLGVPLPAAVWDFGLYFGAWLIGFAHNDGVFERLSRRVVRQVAAALAVGGAAWILTHPGPRGLDLNDNPIGNVLWSTGFVLILIGLAPPDLAWLDRRAFAGWLVTLMNRRAMTVYLWHPAAVVGATTVVFMWDIPLGSGPGLALFWATLAVSVLGAVAIFGWVEDLAARRPVAVIPRQRSRSAMPVQT